jgi:hypothetical protein
MAARGQEKEAEGEDGDAGVHGEGRQQQSGLLSRVMACIWRNNEVINFFKEIKRTEFAAVVAACPSPPSVSASSAGEDS